VMDALGTRENRRAIIGYYRALVRPFPRMPERYRRWAGAEMRAPTRPTLLLHGADDGCLDPRLAALAGPALPPGSAAHVIADAGHFLQLEQPEIVNGLILDFLGNP
jgi:pimeloyl-ACP methyl ester carboxylesterase